MAQKPLGNGAKRAKPNDSIKLLELGRKNKVLLS
jgi:hypothetical protein